MRNTLISVLAVLFVLTGTVNAAVAQPCVDVVGVNGRTLLENAVVLNDVEGESYIDLGNGFHLYAGADGDLGTQDDVVRGFGSYYISDSTGTWKDPLDWRLLDIEDDIAVLMAAYAVDVVPFNLSAYDGNDWEGSNLRSWLNSRGGETEYGDARGFYNTAFNTEEKGKLVVTEVRMDYEGEMLWDSAIHPEGYYGTTGTYPAYNKLKNYAEDYDTSGMTMAEIMQANGTYAFELFTTTGEETKDYVYALSGEEFLTLFGDYDPDKLAGREEWVLTAYRNAYIYGTEYAEAHGLKVHDGSVAGQEAFNGMTDTWTRSPGSISKSGAYTATSISSNGNLNTGKEVNAKGYGALPVIRVALSKEKEETTLLVGAARRAITPTYENGMLPISYVGTYLPFAKSYLTKVLTDIYVRVIALNDGDETALFICIDSGKGPYGPQFVPLYAEHAGIPADNVFFTTTHNHSVPEIKVPIDMDLDINDESYSTLERWAKYAFLQTLDAIDEALENLRPAVMGVGYEDSYINVNRLKPYHKDDGTEYVGQGYNPKGYSDKTLAVIEFKGLDDKPIAFITNYAMHAIVMYLAPVGDGWNGGVHYDVPGYVAEQLEKKYEGSVAIWASGAAGDQNPIVTNAIVTVDPATGGDTVVRVDHVETALVEYLGGIQFDDAQSAIRSIGEWENDVDIATGYAGTTIPSAKTDEETENWAESTGATVPATDTGYGEFGVQLQLLRLGDLALIGHGGELYNSFTKALQNNTDIKHLLVFDNVWSHEEQYITYHPDDYAIEHGSYHSTTQYEPGYLEDALISLANELLDASYRD